jgi:hypothetical protein
MVPKSDAIPFSAPRSDYTLVRVTEWSGDERDSRIFRVSANTIGVLNRYLEDGGVARERCNYLAEALSRLPALAALGIDGLSAAQMQAVMGAYISANFAEIEVDCELNLSSN